MKIIFRRFLKGFIALLPVLVTFWLLSKIVGSVESFAGGIIKTVAGWEKCPSGVGLIAAFFAFVVIGYLLERVSFFQRFYSWASGLLGRIPGVKIIYNAIKDIVGFFDSSKKGDFNKVVKVTLADGTSELGLVTQDSLDGFPKGFADPKKKEVIVLFPWSLQMGGRTKLVPMDMITPIPDMTPDEAFKGIFTAFVSSDEDAENKEDEENGGNGEEKQIC